MESRVMRDSRPFVDRPDTSISEGRVGALEVLRSSVFKSGLTPGKIDNGLSVGHRALLRH